MDSSSWNSEAADLLENLEATQKEVQALMSQQDASAAKLHELKDEATAEVGAASSDGAGGAMRGGN
jgi:chaperonin cofactor prefoldin